MTKNNITGGLDMRFLFHGLLAWAVSALVLLPAAAFMISAAGINSGAAGYISSALSFMAALFAGRAAAAERQGGRLYSGLLCAAVLVTALLTLGFLIRGSEIEPSGILSVVSFSFAGCLVGAVFFSGRKKRPGKTRFGHGRSRGR